MSAFVARADRRSVTLIRAAFGVLALAACDDRSPADPTLYADPGSEGVFVSGLSVGRPTVGQTVEVVASGCRSGICLFKVRGLSWSQSNPSVAALSRGPEGYQESVNVRGLAVGATYVIGHWPGGADSVLVYFRAVDAPQQGDREARR